MNLVGLLVLEKFKEKHADIRAPLNAWILELQKAKWKSFQCIKSRFRSADHLSEGRVCFNIKGNHYRLLVKVNYEREIVKVEWVGTHAEYSKKKF